MISHIRIVFVPGATPRTTGFNGKRKRPSEWQVQTVFDDLGAPLVQYAGSLSDCEAWAKKATDAHHTETGKSLEVRKVEEKP